MSLEKAEKIARAVLYEGYMLYPYRTSALKNRQRCSFGTLYPQAHEAVVAGSEPCRSRTECLLIADASACVTVQVRFLHLLERRIEARLPGATPEFQPVEAIVVDDEVHSALEEAAERRVDADFRVSALVEQAETLSFGFPSTQEVSDLRDRTGELVGRVTRTQKAVAGRIEVKVSRAEEGVFRLSVEVTNCTASGDVLASALASLHTLLRINCGNFISLLDPPEHLREATAALRNLGTYPVLVGDAGEHDVLLSSPIILYDYPQIAPESAGDFFDATEIDEMLTLRVMTLTDEEKREMRDADERMRQLLERTESSAREQLMRTHGVMRNVRPVKDKAA